jgi:competence protein CoiA
MAAAGVQVCWVTTRDAPWLGHVPSVRIANDSGSGWVLTWGVERLVGVRWVAPEEPLSVERFVALVSAWRLEPHLRLRERFEFGSRNAETRGNLTWTHRTYIDAEASQQRRQQQDEARRAAEAVRHQRNIEALLERQKAITTDVVDLVFRKTGVYPECGELAPEFAMGVPVYVRGSLAALICPVASRIPQSPKTRRSTVHIYVATAEERNRMLRYGVFANRVTVIVAGQRNPGSGKNETLTDGPG